MWYPLTVTQLYQQLTDPRHIPAPLMAGHAHDVVQSRPVPEPLPEFVYHLIDLHLSRRHISK